MPPHHHSHRGHPCSRTLAARTPGIPRRQPSTDTVLAGVTDEGATISSWPNGWASTTTPSAQAIARLSAVDELDRVDSTRDADRRRRHPTWIHIVKRRHPGGSLVDHSPFTPWAPG